MGMGHAGIVMGLEVSRLARNNADWHRLLEICALTDTLILDEDGVYDPASFNDRLLLGLKGTMSEAELHVLKARLRGAGRRGPIASGARCHQPARVEPTRGQPPRLLAAIQFLRGVLLRARQLRRDWTELYLNIRPHKRGDLRRRSVSRTNRSAGARGRSTPSESTGFKSFFMQLRLPSVSSAR